jgi:hypothetical protein|tara:strand:- start:676 stop:777 length:102 start_codon:yes stop_codon:yes gene_type:complete
MHSYVFRVVERAREGRPDRVARATNGATSSPIA